MDDIITGEVLTAYMDENNLTLEEVGVKVGASSATVSRWRQGKFIDRLSTQQKLKSLIFEQDQTP